MWSVMEKCMWSPDCPRFWRIREALALGGLRLPSVLCAVENSPLPCPAGLSSVIPRCLPSSQVSCQQLCQRHLQTANLWGPVPSGCVRICPSIGLTPSDARWADTHTPSPRELLLSATATFSLPWAAALCSLAGLWLPAPAQHCVSRGHWG